MHCEKMFGPPGRRGGRQVEPPFMISMLYEWCMVRLEAQPGQSLHSTLNVSRLPTHTTMSPPGDGIVGFQARPSQSQQIDVSTPFVAAGDGDLELLQASIEQLGISPNAADSNGFTFLHAACGYCRVAVIEWLLGLNKESSIINVNARDGDGDTPLHHCDDAISAKMLIEAGADHQLKNDEGQTPLEVKEEELEEGDDEDDSDSDDEDRLKLKELVAYLKSLSVGE